MTPAQAAAADSAVLVITPDAFRRGLGARVIEEVCTAGLRPVASRLVRPGLLELDALYEDVVAHNGQWKTYRYRCVDQLFGLGSSLAVLLHRPAGLALPGGLHEYLQAFKGSGSLHDVDPGCLRRRLGSVNSILSLVHTSGSPEESELDLQIFGRRDWLTASAIRPATPADFVPFDAAVAARMLDSSVPETRGFDDVLCDVRGRLLAHCWEILRPGTRAAAGDELSGRGRDALLDDRLTGRCAADVAARGEHRLAEALTAAFRPGAPPVDTERLWQAMETAGVDTDPWERAVLGTSQYFRPMTTLPDPVPAAAPRSAPAPPRPAGS